MHLPSRRLVIYYMQGLLPWPILVLILHKMSSSHYDIILFSIAYLWHCVLNTPEDCWEDYLKKRRYRFSSIRMVLLLHRYLEKEMAVFLRYPPLIRFISPSVFNLLIMSLAGQGNFLYSLAGSFIFEVTFHLLNKKNCILKK